MNANTKLSKVQAIATLASLLVSFFLGFASPTKADFTSLLITGVIDGPLSGGLPKAVEFYVLNNIADLSIYGFGSANNGGGTDGEEFTFPADSATAGDFIYVATEAIGFTSFFGFAPNYTSSAASINGDDAIELFQSGAVVDVFGDINVDGTGQPWEYLDGWAYRVDGTGPDGTTFTLANWSFSGPNALDGETTNASAATPFPIGTYSPGGDTPPSISNTTPGDGDTGVAVDTNIGINFSEDVTVTGNWFDISCTNSGGHTAAVSGGPQNYTLDPDVDFDNGETCTVSIYAAQVSDTDTDDPPDNMAADYQFSFDTALGATDFIINEIHADPDGSIAGDANGDGTRDSSDDEFVEIVNNTGADADISGWTLSDAIGVRHTFPAGTVVPGQCAVVVFGGGTPTGSFGGAVVQTAGNGALGLNNSGDTVTLNNGTSDVVSYTYGSEGGDNQSLTRNPDITGPEPLVKHTTATGSGGALFSPGTKVDGSSFFGCTCGDPATFIHDIQGNGASSPEVGNTHVIEGVVVGDFQDTSTQLSGFFVQEEDADTDADPTTSEGIFVYDNGFGVDVSVGDVARVMGDVAEYHDLTELNNVSNVVVCSQPGSASAATVALPVASRDAWERYEGMLIYIPQTLYATGNYNQGRYGEVDLSVGNRLFNPTNVVEPGAPALAWQDLNDRSRIQLDDGSTVEYPSTAPYIGAGNTLRAGDTIPELTGVLGCYDDYEVHPTGTINFARVNTRDATPPAVGGTLKVASFNVLNYFNGDGLGGGFPTSRGADTPDEFNRQRDKIISAISTMDADVIGLMEMENDAPPNSAIEDLVDGLNAVAGAGTYDFIDTGIVGSDEIRVAFIYKPGTVTPVGPFKILDSSVDTAFIDTKNRPALAQTFEQNSSGARFTPVANHLKSKGSPCDDVGDPDVGDGQGNCNQTRTDGATALVNWLATDPTGSGDPDFLIIGDLNSYAMEDPITAIKNAGYTNLVETFIGADAYSYVYDGQAGYLDHALASAALTPQVTGVVEWHINADEPAALDYNDHNQPALYNSDPFRASDHDPVIVGLNLELDTDGDGAPDSVEGTGDRDGDGIPDNEDYDPTGYFYDETSGQIIPGGQIAVTGPGAVAIVQDGSSGFYQFTTDGTGGTYIIQVTLPPGCVWSDTCLRQDPPPFDPTGGPNPTVLGNGENGTTGFLISNACTDYYLSFDLAAEDPFIFNNNFPLRRLFTLTVNKAGGGTGTVTSDPAGINCGADCTENYPQDTLVTLTAHPGVKSYLVGWSGDCAGTERTAQVTMDADRTCTATFGYPVGGVVVPVNKVELLALRLRPSTLLRTSSGQAPWMGLAGLAALAGLTVTLVRRCKG